MNKFTKQEDELLAESVSKYPPLYDPQNKDNKDLNIKEAIWAEVSKSVGRSGEEYKKRFKNLKDSYRRNKQARKQGTGSSALTKPTKWFLAPYLSFLDNIPQERDSISNFNSEVYENEHVKENHNEGDISMEVPVEAHVQHHHSSKMDNKRKNITDIFEKRSKERMDLFSKLSTINSPPKELDDIDLFFKSLSLTVKKLPPNRILQAKLKCMTVVSGLEQQYLDITLNNHKENASSSQSSLSSTSYSDVPPRTAIDQHFEQNRTNQQIHKDFQIHNNTITA